MRSETTGKYFDTDTKIKDVIYDPLFGNHGRLIFPVNPGYYSGDTLGDLSMDRSCGRFLGKTNEMTASGGVIWKDHI